eukprot:Gregarina_sp_Pseudo_9__1670@NODE_2126_length_1136_cov_440_104831_g1962_i0_p3_GENE_NODE_2126_length_1136_cov_440_104831_g1962_i0NODE_2126_length_1136_cov_440_104831_g1962_i0_p3_ORF_typecomplete_len101_score8_09_NODE_2126_length_1136_cov_440_104831_g1962_i0686988
MDHVNAFVLGDFSHNTAITATDNQHLLGVWMSEEGDVSQHFVVRKFVHLRVLEHAIQNHQISESSRLVQLDILVGCLLFVQQTATFVGLREAMTFKIGFF